MTQLSLSVNMHDAGRRVLVPCGTSGRGACGTGRGGGAGLAWLRSVARDSADFHGTPASFRGIRTAGVPRWPGGRPQCRRCRAWPTAPRCDLAQQDVADTAPTPANHRRCLELQNARFLPCILQPRTADAAQCSMRIFRRRAKTQGQGAPRTNRTIPRLPVHSSRCCGGFRRQRRSLHL